MMPIPETQLKTWSQQGATQPSKTTYAAIKNVLEDVNAPYPVLDVTVFLQGSYWNDTNIQKDSDVDLVIRLDTVYFSDLDELKPDQLVAYNADRADATYGLPEFKKDVVAWLSQKFDNVRAGSKAVSVPGNNNRRSADVIIAAEFRRYSEYQSASKQKYETGICFFDSTVTRIENFPKQHGDHFTSKHQSTNGNFKPMVRVLKNVRNKLVADGKINDGSAPSYYLEGLLYNVSAKHFTSNYADSLSLCLDEIVKADRTQYLCVNQMFYLIRDGSPVCWKKADADAFIDAAVDLWNNWK